MSKVYVVNIHNWYSYQDLEWKDEVFYSPGEAADFIRHLNPIYDWGIRNDDGQWLEVMIELYYHHPSVKKFVNLTLEEAKKLRYEMWRGDEYNENYEPDAPVLAMLIGLAEEYGINHLGTAYDMFQWEHVYA